MARAAREGAMCALRDVQRSSVVGDGAGGARSVEIAQAGWFPWRVRSRVGVAEGVWREVCVCVCV